MEAISSERVLAVIEEELGHVDPAMSFDELALDSLEQLDLIQRVEKETGRKFSDSAITEMNSVQDILDACAITN